jgi:hypothetical protein
LCSLLWDGWLWKLETLYNASVSLVDVHIVRTGGSSNFSLSYGGSKRGGGFEIACAHFSSAMPDYWNLVQCFIAICRCAYCFDRRIQVLVWWIQKGWRMWNKFWMLILLLVLSRPVLLVH